MTHILNPPHDRSFFLTRILISISFQEAKYFLFNHQPLQGINIMKRHPMIRILLIFILLSLFLFIMSSISTRSTSKQGPFRVAKTTLAKGTLDKWTEGVPIQPTTSFTTQDKEVVSHVKYVNLTRRHTLRWEWYSPDGNLYYTTRDYTIGTSRYIYVEEGTSCHKISIKETRAEEYHGKRNVKVYLDDLSAEFTFFTKL